MKSNENSSNICWVNKGFTVDSFVLPWCPTNEAFPKSWRSTKTKVNADMVVWNGSSKFNFKQILLRFLGKMFLKKLFYISYFSYKIACKMQNVLHPPTLIEFTSSQHYKLNVTKSVDTWIIPKIFHFIFCLIKVEHRNDNII